MPDIFDYNDYRAFLQDHYQEEKKSKPHFSYRYMSGKTGVNPGFLIRVMQGKAHLPVKDIPTFADFYRLFGRRREYWNELVLFGRAKQDSEVYMRYERLQAIKGIHLDFVEAGQLEFLSHWRHNAIRSLLGIVQFSEDYLWLGQQLNPPCTAQEAKESVELLERLGMAGRTEGGTWETARTFLTAGGEAQKAAVRGFQSQVMELGIASLETIPRDRRDVSTVTITIDRKELPIIQERIQAFRQELFRISSESEGDNAVMQLNVQLFPLAWVQGEDAQ